MHWGLLPVPPHQFAWLASDGALAVLVAASILEVLGDKVPLLDHGLQAIHTVAKPIAGAVIAGAVVAPGNDPSSILLGVLGGANALAIHGVSATARAASTASTGGLANPIVSVVEDALAIGGILLGWFLPFLAAALVLAATIVGIVCVRRLIGYVAAHRERRVGA
jgi:4-hydroxybenzoate polyprenyltransferase